MITHELDTLPEDAERMDRYIARRIGTLITGEEYWFAECAANNVEIRDRFNIESGVFDRTGWYLQHWTGLEWVRLLDLEPGERPRMHQTYCYVVKEPANA